jgi:hypothetical protein
MFGFSAGTKKPAAAPLETGGAGRAERRTNVPRLWQVFYHILAELATLSLDKEGMMADIVGWIDKRLG